jgi:peptide/nickel transport system substrate-binding protein
MSRLDRFAATILVVALVFVAVAMAVPRFDPFGQPGSPRPTPTPFREGILGHPSSITPLTARTQVDRDLVALIFRGLVQEGPDGTPVPDLARSWTVSGNGRTYTFLLRTDAFWEDGVPVTASDVVFTVGLLQASDYQGPAGASWHGISATAESTHVVRIDLPTSLGGFLQLATQPLVPEHLLSDLSAAELADSDFASHPVGNGAFQLLEVDSTHAVLQRLASGAASAEPSEASSPSTSPTSAPSAGGGLDELDLSFFDDPAAMVAEFRAGRLDAVGGLAPDSTAAAAHRTGARLISYPWAMMTGVILNQRSSHNELRDLNVRLAWLGAIDRQTLVSSVFGDRGIVADVPLAPWSSLYDPASVSRVLFDVVAARTRMSAAGWTETVLGWVPPGSDGPYVVKLLTPDEATEPLLYRAASAVVADWRSLDLNAQVEAVSATEYVSRLRSGDFLAAIADFRLGLDPDLSPLLSSSEVREGGANVSGYRDSTLDRLLAGVRTSTGTDTRRKAVVALEKYLAANVPILPLAFRDYQYVVSDRVQGVTSNQLADPSGRYWDVIDWRLASDG